MNLLLRIIALGSLLIFAYQAQADIIDRVNECEQRNGADGCIYDLMRELARGSGSNQPDQIVSWCECRFVNSNCNGRASGSFLTVITENITRGTVSSRQLGCFHGSSGPGSAERECAEAQRTHPRCR